MFASLPAHPLTSSRRRPGPTANILVDDACCVKKSPVACERTALPSALKPVVGPGLRGDDGEFRFSKRCVGQEEFN